MHIEMVDHTEFPLERRCPVGKNVRKPVPGRDPEGKIDIGPPVARTDGGRTGQGSPRDSRIAPDQFEDTVAHPVAKLGCEHAAPAAYR